QRREVQRLVEGALVGRALAGDGDRDPVGALALERERLAERRRVALGDDAGAGEVRRRVEQVHVPAAAATQPGLAAEDLRGHLAQVDAVRDGEVVRAVRGGDRVAGGEVGTDTGRDRVLG